MHMNINNDSSSHSPSEFLRVLVFVVVNRELLSILYYREELLVGHISQQQGTNDKGAGIEVALGIWNRNNANQNVKAEMPAFLMSPQEFIPPSHVRYESYNIFAMD